MMNLLRVSFTAATHKTFRCYMLSTNVNTMVCRFATAAGNMEINRRGDNCVTYYTLITDELSRAFELLDHIRPVKGLSSNETNYTSLIDSLCKQDRFDEAYRVFIEMIVSGFSPPDDTLNDVVRGFLRIGEMNQKGDYVTYNTLITEMCKAEELSHAVQLLDHMQRVKGLSPNETTFTSLIDYLCKHDRIDEAYKVLNEMFLSGFSPSFLTMNDILRGFLRLGETGKAYETHKKMFDHMCTLPDDEWCTDDNTESWLQQSLSDGVAYTSLMNVYLDEGKLDNVDKLLYDLGQFDFWGRRQFDRLPDSVKNSVFINGLDKKARTTNTKKYLLRFNYDLCLSTPTLEYRRTLGVNCSDDEFKCQVELVEGLCNSSLKNAYYTMLKWNYKPDGITYNLFIIEHCKRNNVDLAYNMYKEMVHRGFACHMFTVFALIRNLCWKGMINELRWVIQNVLRSCNLNDSEIVKFHDEFNPEELDNEALYDVLAEKAKDGLFLKCSYAPPSA